MLRIATLSIGTMLLIPVENVFANTKDVNIEYVEYDVGPANNTIDLDGARVLDLEYRYRTYNGYIQYRRWDRTNNRWYDPEWITIGHA